MSLQMKLNFVLEKVANFEEAPANQPKAPTLDHVKLDKHVKHDLTCDS